MKILIFIALFFAVSNAAPWSISYNYIFYSTNFTNNGGVDNSTCDIAIDLEYLAGPITPSSYVQYAGFAFIYTDAGNLASAGGYVAGDQGFACNVDYNGGSTSWTCR